MIPPFSTVDHRIDSSPLPYEERRVLRRSAPQALRFDLPSPGRLAVRPVAHPLPEPSRGRFSRFAAMLRLWAPA
jgi:hypothetical protein